MGRQERRKQLLALARDIISEGGLAALTMENLADRAKVSKPIVYSHFADRNGVAMALMEDHFTALRAFSGDRLANATTLRDYISAIVDSSFAFETASDTPIRKMSNGFSAGDEVNQIYLREEALIRKKWENALIELGVDDPVAAVSAPMLLGMITASVRYFADKLGEELPEPDRFLKDKARETLVLLLMVGIHALTRGYQVTEETLSEFNEPVSRAVAKAYRVGLGETSIENALPKKA